MLETLRVLGQFQIIYRPEHLVERPMAWSHIHYHHENDHHHDHRRKRKDGLSR